MGNNQATQDKQIGRNPRAPPTSPRTFRPNSHTPTTSTTPGSETLNFTKPQLPNLTQTTTQGTTTNTPQSAGRPTSVRFSVPGLQLQNLQSYDVAHDTRPVSVRYSSRPLNRDPGFKTPPLSPRDTNREFKIFHFHYNGKQKDLKVYEGTPVELVWRTLFQQLGIPHTTGATLESLIDSISIVDSDGCSLVFSPEHIPHDEKLYVHDCVAVADTHTKTESSEVTEDSAAESNSEEGDEVEFSWDSKWNSLYCGYSLADDDRTVTIGNSLVARSTSMPILISNRSFKKGTGVYKWRVVFKEDMTHHAAGIVSEEEIIFPRKCASFGNHFPSVPWFHKTSPMGEKSTVIILDTNKSKVTINGKVFEGIPDKVYAGLCFKMSLNMEAQLLFDVE